MIDLSITIASYNSLRIIRQALASIRKETRDIDYEVIVVDNASTDGSADMIVKEFPWARLIRNERNLGFASAHNRALSEAGGQFILVLNSDILFINNPAARMVDRLRSSKPNIGIVGPQIVNQDGSLAPSSRRRIFSSRRLAALSAINQSFPFGRLLPVNFMRRHFGRYLGRVHENFAPLTSAQEVEWLDGMCVMFKRELLRQTGLFDEQYFFDYEIGDLLIRARAKGWGILFDPDIRVTHLGAYSRRKTPRIMIESHRGQLIYYAKHKPDYVSTLRRIHLILFWLKVKLMEMACPLSGRAEKWHAQIEILKEARKAIAEFNPDSVREREHIPKIMDAPDS